MVTMQYTDNVTSTVAEALRVVAWSDEPSYR